MSINAQHLIRHNFRDVHDKAASTAFVFRTIEKLKERLFIYGVDNLFAFNYEEDYDEYSFELPFYEVSFYLQNGCWQITSPFSYHRVTSHIGGYFPARCNAYDIARALGQSEAWHISEDYTDGEGYDAIHDSFEHWLDYADKMIKEEEAEDHRFTKVPEFDYTDILKTTDDWDINGDIYDYVNAYHDSFKECEEQFSKIQNELKDMELLGLTRIGNKFLRCRKSDGLYLVDEDTLQPLFDEPIDCVLNSFGYYYSGPFVVIKNGLSAVYDKNGKALTDFVNGTFGRDWVRKGEQDVLVIYNNEAQIALEL